MIQPPPPAQPVVGMGANATPSWWAWFQRIGQQLGTQSAASGVGVGPSPSAYTAPSNGFAIVAGGNVSAVLWSRGATSASLPAAGMFYLGTGDVLTVTYSVAPTITWVPL